MSYRLPLILVASCFMLSSCAGGLIAAGGVAAGSSAAQEGGLSRAVSDARIQAEINDLWFNHNFTMFRKLDMTINKGRVLVTGVVQDPQHRVDAVRLAWQPEGVVQVINEITVADSKGIVGFASDAWISTTLRSSFIVDKQVQSINYTIDTVGGAVYLMGFAQSNAELGRAIDIARNTRGVKQVVSYVKVKGSGEDLDSAFQKGPQNNNAVAQGGFNASQPTPQQQYQLEQQRAPSGGNDLVGFGREPVIQSPATAEPIEWTQESVYD